MPAPAVTLRAPSESDETPFLAAVARSTALHRPWAQPPTDVAGFAAYLERSRLADHAWFLAWHGDGLVGALNLSHIVRGALEGAFLGYYAFEPLARRGLMRVAMQRLIDEAFTNLRLHRLEANIQPGNERSKHLVASLGFRREGFSPRYLNIAGEWRDHERWALLADEWSVCP